MIYNDQLNYNPTKYDESKVQVDCSIVYHGGSIYTLCLYVGIEDHFTFKFNYILKCVLFSLI